MSSHAASTFVIESWDEQPWHERDGVQLKRARVVKTFSGDLEGRSVAELVLGTAREGSAAYGGLELVEGSLHGRSGSFVLRHDATMTAAGQSAEWTIVPGSGTDELASISGIAEIVVDADGGHSLALDYDLD